MMLGGELGTLAVGLVMAGVVAGFLSGALGSGAIVLVPALYQVLAAMGLTEDMRMHIAIGTAFAAMLPTALLMLSRETSATDWALVKRWAAPLVIGAVLGALLSAYSSGQVLMILFGVVGLAAAAYFLLSKRSWRLAAEPPRGPVDVAVPAAIGGVSGMIGIDAGTLGLPALSLFSVEKRIGASWAFGAGIALAGTTVAVVAGWGEEGLPRFSYGYVNLLAFGIAAPITFFTAMFGAHMAAIIDGERLKKLFGLLVTITALKMLWDAF